MIKKIHHHIRHHKTTYGKYIVLVLICLTLFASLLTREVLLSEKKMKKVPLQKTIPILKNGEGVLQISTKDRKSVYSVSENIDVIVSGSSGDQPIVGYDVVVVYDSTKLEFLKVKSLNTNFQMFSSPTRGELNLTGVKEVNVNDSLVLINSPLAEAQFKALTSGSTSIQILFLPNSTTESNLMNKNNKDIVGRVKNISVTVEN